MEISNPRRILLVGPPDSAILDLLQDLTGSIPTPNQGTQSLAGLSHTLPIKTAYYTANVAIWIDSIPDSSSPSPDTKSPHAASPAAGGPAAPPSSAAWTSWADDYVSAEAKEVLSALGAIVVCFRKPSSKDEFEEIRVLLREVKRVVDACSGPGWDDGDGGGFYGGDWDGVCLAVGMKRRVLPGLEVSSEEWEEMCGDFGFEYVDGEVNGKGKVGKMEKNEFGELVGLPRLLEALETNDWAPTSEGNDLDDVENFNFDTEGDNGLDSTGFGAEAAELEMEMFGMKRAIYGLRGDGEDQNVDEDIDDGGKGNVGEDEEDEVEKLEALMLRMQAVRDMGADMPEAERKRFAAKAVRDIMNTL